MKQLSMSACALAVALLLGASSLEAQEPSFTPIDVRARLTNAAEVAAVILAEIESLAAKEEDWLMVRRGAEGDHLESGRAIVVLWVFVDTTGVATQARLERQDDSAPIPTAVKKAASQMRFQPAQHRGRPVAGWLRLPVIVR